MDEIDLQRQTILRRMARLDEELAKLESIPRDEYEEGTVLKFKLRFREFRTSSGYNSSPWFNYAALKIKGHWYPTSGSRNQRKMTWAELQKWWSDNEVKKVRVATKWSKIEDLNTEDDQPIYDDRSTD